MIYIGHENVVREVSQGAVGIGGVTRTVYDGWCGVDGVARQFMGGKITADMIEKVELVLSLLMIEQIDSNGDTVGDDALLWTVDPSKEDLNFSSSYGSATIDGLTVTVTGKKGYFVELGFNLYITLKSGYRMYLDDRGVSKLDDPRASVYFYLRVSAASTTVQYGDEFCGLDYWPSSLGTTAKTSTQTGALTDATIWIGAGVLKGSGTMTTRLTIQDFTIGGVQFMPEIIYNS